MPEDNIKEADMHSFTHLLKMEDRGADEQQWGLPQTLYFKKQFMQSDRSSSSKTQECPSCAMKVDAKAETCPICGYELPRQKRSTVIVVWLLIFLMLVWVFI